MAGGDAKGGNAGGAARSGAPGHRAATTKAGVEKSAAAAGSDRAARSTLPLPTAVRTAPILNPLDAAGHPTAPPLPESPGGGPFRVAVPLAIDAVQERSIALAAEWRATTRRALTWGLARGLGVRAFYRDDAAGVAYYVLAASPLAGES